MIVTFDVSSTVFEIMTFQARKWLVFHTSSVFDAPARENPSEFLDETYATKWGPNPSFNRF